MSTYFPSPPELTTPPIALQEADLDLDEKLSQTGEGGPEKEPLEEACEERVENLSDLEIEHVEMSRASATAVITATPVYEWPSKSPNNSEVEVRQR